MVALGVMATNAVALPPPSLVLVPPRPAQVRTARHPTVEFGESLRRQCAFFAGVSGVTIRCTAVRQRLPWAVASQLTLIAEELLARAFMAFEGGRGGRIDVSFGAVPTSLELTVEHSRPPTAASDRQLGRSATLVWRVVDRLGGRLQSPRMIGGVRTGAGELFRGRRGGPVRRRGGERSRALAPADPVWRHWLGLTI